MSSTKQERVDFVSSHSGGSPLEILTILSLSPLFFLCYFKLSRLGLSHFAVEFAVVVVGQLFATFSGQFWGKGTPFVHQLSAMVFTFLVILRGSRNGKGPKSLELSTVMDFVTTYRTTIYLLTFTSILAVDFPIYPRRYCKTEEFGYGLMDLGTASFIMMR